MLRYFLRQRGECVRSPAAQQCAPDNPISLGALERARFQSTDVFHSPGGAFLRTWSPQQVQVYKPGYHVELPVELRRRPVVGVCDAVVALEPAD